MFCRCNLRCNFFCKSVWAYIFNCDSKFSGNIYSFPLKSCNFIVSFAKFRIFFNAKVRIANAIHLICVIIIIIIMTSTQLIEIAIDHFYGSYFFPRTVFSVLIVLYCIVYLFSKIKYNIHLCKEGIIFIVIYSQFHQ